MCSEPLQKKKTKNATLPFHRPCSSSCVSSHAACPSVHHLAGHDIDKLIWWSRFFLKEFSWIWLIMTIDKNEKTIYWFSLIKKGNQEQILINIFWKKVSFENEKSPRATLLLVPACLLRSPHPFLQSPALLQSCLEAFSLRPQPLQQPSFVLCPNRFAFGSELCVFLCTRSVLAVGLSCI